MRYQWQRVWYEPHDTILLDDQSGYLLDFTALDPRAGQKVLPYSAIAKNSCLILLGDAGSGKTTSLKEALKLEKHDLAEEPLWVDLKDLSEDRLRRYLFEHSAWRAWREGLRALEVFLDSLDECYMHLSALPALLVQELRGGPLARLRLRVVCRTAVWPATLGVQLGSMWPDGVKTYLLAPLRRTDILSAAHQRGLDAGSFVARVDESGAAPLAAVPQTLELLFSLESGGRFPRTRAELFAKGCQKLCEEPDTSRWEQAHAGHTTTKAGAEHTQRRLWLGSQIAACTLFSGRGGLWLGRPSECPEGYLCPDLDLPLNELASNMGELRDLSRAPIFRVEQGELIHWTHRSFCEYLAAQFAVGLPKDKAIELLIHPDSPHVVPQLAGVAAWMASQDPDIFQLLLQRDPHFLLAADLGLTEPQDRHDLVQALLNGLEEGRLSRDAPQSQFYFKLDHPGLAEQLRGTIADRSLSALTRSEAIRMAWKCQASSLQELLVDLAINADEDRRVREIALLALTRMGADGALRARLLPLATAPDDPEDELKGFALMVLLEFPPQIEPARMFAVLTPPKRENFCGAYRTFIEETLVRDLEPSLLPPALAWLYERRPACHHGGPFESLADSILSCALDNLTDAILPDFAKAVRFRLESHSNHVFGWGHRRKDSAQVVLTAEIRRKLLVALVRLYPASREGVYYGWGRHDPPLIVQDDAGWLLDQLETEKDPETRVRWAKLIRAYYGAIDERLHEAASQHRELFEEYSYFFKEVAIDSPEAERCREMQREIARREEEDRQLRAELAARRVAFDPDRVEQYLVRFESGDLAAFWRLNLALLAPPEGKPPLSPLCPDIKTFPGWDCLSPDLQTRTLQAALRYLLSYVPRKDGWFNDRNTIYHPEMAGYRALLLLQTDNSTGLLQLPPGIWAKWAPTVVGYPLRSNTMETPSRHQKLVAQAYNVAPSAVLEVVARLIEGSEQLNEGEQYDLWKLEQCRDARMGLALFKLARREPPRRPATLQHLLHEALLCPGNHHADVQHFAEGLLLHASSHEQGTRERALIAGSVLLTRLPSASFSALWTAITRDTEFGKALLVMVAEGLSFGARHTASWAGSLSADQIGMLWQWLCVNYPRAGDPEVNGLMEARHMISDLRDGLFRALMESGTKAACQTIGKLIEALREQEPWLPQAFLRAQEIYRQKSWEPISPQQLLSMSKGQPMVCQAVLLTAIDIETRAVLDVLREAEITAELRTVANRDLHFFTLEVNGRSIQCCVAQSTDKRSAAAQALYQDVARSLNPRLVLMVGACGGFDDRAKENEGIVARQIFHYEPEQIKRGGHGKRPEIYRCSARVMNLVKALKAGGSLDSILGGAKLHTDKDFASGDKTIKDDEAPLRRYLHELSEDIYGFEQEAPGILHGAWEMARNPQWAAIQVGLIKVVSDAGDAAMNIDKEKRQYAAAQRAARIALAVLCHFNYREV